GTGMGLDESEPHWTASRAKPHNEAAERLLWTDCTGPPLYVQSEDYSKSTSSQCRWFTPILMTVLSVMSALKASRERRLLLTMWDIMCHFGCLCGDLTCAKSGPLRA